MHDACLIRITAFRQAKISLHMKFCTQIFKVVISVVSCFNTSGIGLHFPSEIKIPLYWCYFSGGRYRPKPLIGASRRHLTGSPMGLLTFFSPVPSAAKYDIFRG